MNQPTQTISRYFSLLLLVLLLFTCEERYFPDLDDIESENELVVEGFITNAEGPQKITLTRTVAVGSSATSIPKESGATVEVVDQNGVTHRLTETDPGVYLTNEAVFRGQIGNAYQLKIELSDGEIYESDFQEFLTPAPINDLWFERDTKETIEGRIVGSKEVVRFFTNYNEHTEPAYYRYDHFGTYAFTSELQGNPVCWRNPADVPDGLVSSTICYLNRSANLPFNVSTYPDPIAGTTDFVEMFDIPFDLRFRLGYSVLVKKYRLTKEYHDYMSAVRAQIEIGGSIFDSPPTQIIGNIRNITDPRRPALGYFSTQALVTKRLFVPSLGAQRLEVLTYIASLGRELLIGRCWYAPNLPRPDDIPKFLDCCDCRIIPGASDQRPDFWVD